MGAARLRSTQEDYKELGLKKGEVELWEDGLRTGQAAGTFEWWYFDAMMDDGSSVSLNFATNSSQGPEPVIAITFNATTPDGTKFKDVISCSKEESSFAVGTCDVKAGASYFTGDLKEYAIKVEPVNGFGCDLKLHSLCSSWRPETGHVTFGGDKFFTWLFVVPQGTVTGTMTVEGKTWEVTGEGYHDHQWGNVNLLGDFNSWIWGRQIFKDYTVLIFDLITGQASGYQRFPFFCVQDKNGNVVFSNTEANDSFTCAVPEEYYEEEIGDQCPKKINYTYGNDGIEVSHQLCADRNIYVNDMYRVSPPQMKAIFDKMGLAPAYVRYKADGKLQVKGEGIDIEREGQLVYEFAYFSTHYADVMNR